MAGRDTVRSPLSGSDLESSKKRYRESHRGQRKGSPLAFLIFLGKKGKSVSGQWSHRGAGGMAVLHGGLSWAPTGERLSWVWGPH